MYYLAVIRIFIFKVLLVIVPALLNVAYVTVAERKTMASMQRRLGPNAVGYYGLLQAFTVASNIFGIIFKRFVIINLFNEHINIYLNHFLVNLKQHLLNHSLNKSFDFSFDSLIVKIYNDVRKINPLICFFLGYCIYMFLGDLILIYLSYFLYLIGISVQLIVILKNWIENTNIKIEFPLVHYIIKYFLLCLLIINLWILIIVGQKVWFLILNFIKKLFFKSHIITKLKDMKLSLEYKLRKSPKNPKDSNNLFFFQQKKDEKSKKLELKKRAEELKNKVLENQTSSLIPKDFKELSFCKNRNWNATVPIDKNTEFTVADQIKHINEELDEYKSKIEKFKQIVINIDKGKENFYPNEARSILNNYIDIIENKLIPNLKRQIKNFQKKMY
jgi:hypothetical protein